MMLRPGHGKTESRLKDAEIRGEQTLRIGGFGGARHSRDAGMYCARRGRHRGKTLSSLTKGNTVSVALWYWNGTQYVDSQKRVTARCWFLNEDDTIEAGTKVLVEFIGADNQWEITQAWCAIDDTQEETGGGESPGEQSQAQSQAQAEGEPAGEVAQANDPNQQAIGGPQLWPV